MRGRSRPVVPHHFSTPPQGFHAPHHRPKPLLPGVQLVSSDLLKIDDAARVPVAGGDGVAGRIADRALCGVTGPLIAGALAIQFLFAFFNASCRVGRGFSMVFLRDPVFIYQESVRSL